MFCVQYCNVIKKILIWGVIIFLIGIGGFTNALDVSGCEERKFMVTAYYSPQKQQIFYYKQTFEEEVILNGSGYTGASGKSVFNGMLAAPESYPFGSIIYFPGRGIGEVADRGGAIVVSGEKGQIADRIDIWMGRGEEGLIRALTFGKQLLTGRYCPPEYAFLSKEKIGFGDDFGVSIPKYFFDMAIWIQELKPGRKDIRVWTLQKYLVKLGYLHKKHWHGEYNGYTKKALCTYQVARNIVGAKHQDCGTFGKLTRSVMKLEVQTKGLLPEHLYEQGNLETLLDLAQYYNGKPVEVVSQGTTSAQQQNNPKIFLFYRAYTRGQQSSEIKILQKFLASEGLYSGAIDGIYHQATINAVHEFQKKYGLISDTDPLLLRGYLGPKTRAKINELRRK